MCKAMAHNIYDNAFWMYWNSYLFDMLRFDFFQQLSSIGGFMQLLIYGGGKLSIDARMKKD